MNATEGKVTFDINRYRTQKTGAADVVYCLAERQHSVCGHALPFGYGRICTHPRRNEFSEITRRKNSSWNILK